MSSDGCGDDRRRDRPRGEQDDCGVDGPLDRHAGRRDGRAASDRSAPVDCARPPLLPAIELEHSIVRYRDRPDRCTVFPPDASGVARLSTWLSVDRELLCPLEEWR